MYIFFETERLLVRQYTMDDVDGLHEVMSDERVHTYTKDRNNPWDRARTSEYVQFMIDKDFKKLDCFHGAVIEKSSGKIIGLCGLNPYRDNAPEIEYKLGVQYWNKGYATELGRGIIESAFANTDIIGIYGMAHKANTASRKVLEKLGMKYLEDRRVNDIEESFYYISNTEKQT